MKIFYESRLAKLITFIKDFSTIMLFGAVFTELKENVLNPEDREHEGVHCGQYSDLFWIGLILGIMHGVILLAYRGWNSAPTPYAFFLFCWPVFLYYVYYGIEYLIRLVGAIHLFYFGKNKNIYYIDGRLLEASMYAYRNIAFEREASDLQWEFKKVCPQVKKKRSTGSWMKYYKKQN